MVTIIQVRRAGVTYTCDSACYDAATTPAQCECICGGTNHARGVSGLFGEDVPRKEEFNQRRVDAFMGALRSAPEDMVGGIRMDPSQRTVSDVEVFLVRRGNVLPILHRCAQKPSLRIECCSPTGFNWGYGGSGPNELARYILGRAVSPWYYHSPGTVQAFKRRFLVSALDSWMFSVREIREWLAARREHSHAAV